MMRTSVLYEKYKFIEEFRLHAAAYLMMDIDPPPDEYTEILTPHDINFLYLKDKPIPLTVDHFLKKFSKLWFEGAFPDIQKKFENQKHENSGYIKEAKDVLNYQYKQQKTDSFYIMDPNGFFPIELTRQDLEVIADIMGLKPAFLQGPVYEVIPSSRARIHRPLKPFSRPEPTSKAPVAEKKDIVTENHISKQHQQAKDRCRKIAKQILKEKPDIDTISEAIFDDRMTDAATKANGDMYSESAIRGWIKDLFPDKARKPGKRPKR